VNLGDWGGREARRPPVPDAAPPSQGLAAPEQWSEHLLKGLRGSGNLVDITVSEPGGDVMCPWAASAECLLLSGPVFSLRVNLPRRLQKYGRQRFSSIPMESFSVISTGSIFAAYGSTEQVPVFTSIGHEYRELVVNQLANQPRLRGVTLGPSPIHPGFYVITVAADETSLPPVERFRGHGEDFVTFVSDKHPIDAVVRYLLLTAESALLFFYRTMMRRSEVLLAYVNTMNGFFRATEKIEALHKTARYRLFRIDHLGRETTEVISNVYSSLADLQRRSLDYEGDFAQMLRVVERNQVLGVSRSYFGDRSDDMVEVPESVLPALAHFQGQVDSHSNARTTVLASIGGGIIGALLTGLFA